MRLFSLLLLGALPACKGRSGAAREDWARWFDERAAKLARWDGSGLPVPDGPIVRAPGGLSVQLGRNFWKRNDYGCWASARDKWPGAG